MICYKSVENQEICDAIWENQPHDENLTFWVFSIIWKL